MKKLGSILVSTFVVALGAACATTNNDMVIGYDCDSGFCKDAPPPAFTAPDAAPELNELTNYCASNHCPTGYTTCSTSTFQCDVDIRSDRMNCGACDSPCPQGLGYEQFDCVNGKCALTCKGDFLDCDGIPDNGCEVARGTDNDNCRACGDKCPEDKPCMQVDSEPLGCGCPQGYTYCPDVVPPTTRKCFLLDVDDNACGACGNVCPPVDEPPPPHAHYGCVEGECGRLKCDEGFDDCNGVVDDGCETPLGTHENCTRCGENCLLTDQRCIAWVFDSASCKCPAGTTFCGTGVVGDFELLPWFGKCADFSSDRFNCGGCGRWCPGDTPRSRGVCSFGQCELECVGRWKDCNGNTDDDCETDTFGDPTNCGGCGITCDIEHGQACAGGRCVVEPCKEGEGPQ